MEKKTMGKFIAALRQAKGLTQKELGDMLYVSNKAVSRWENDECTPDLNLIPAIADIFGVTCDELLRGERRQGNEQAANEGTATTERGKRQLEGILRKKYATFRNLSFISFGLAFLGLIAAIICICIRYNGVSNGEPWSTHHPDIGWLTFLLAAIFAAGGIICEVCFAMNGIFKDEEEFAEYKNATGQHNARILKLAMAAIMTCAALIGLCLPQLWASYSEAVPYLIFGSGLACIFLLAAYGIYFKCVRAKMIADGAICYTNEQALTTAANNKLLFKISLICGIIYILLAIFIILIPQLDDIFWVEDGTASAYYGDTARSVAGIAMMADAVAGIASYFGILAARNRRKKLNKN